MNGRPRVVGLDPSLTSFGVAVVQFAGQPDEPQQHYVVTDRLRTHATGYARWDWLLERVGENVHGADLVVLEGPSYASPSGAQVGHHERAGLWHAVAFALWSRNVPTAIVSPGGRAKYATGNGRAKKPEVLAAVRARYPQVVVQGHDDADALVLAAMGCHACVYPIHGQPLDEKQLQALAAVDWSGRPW